MIDDDLRQLFHRILGTGADLDYWTAHYDFSFCARCHPKNIERAATMLRDNRREISLSIRARMPSGGDMPDFPRLLPSLPYFVCLERDRSLIIPRPKFVPADIFAAAIVANTGDLLSFPKRKPA